MPGANIYFREHRRMSPKPFEWFGIYQSSIFATAARTIFNPSQRIELWWLPTLKIGTINSILLMLYESN
jgi:hypothetical protein